LLLGYSDENALIELLLTYKVFLYVLILLSLPQDVFCCMMGMIGCYNISCEMQTLANDATVGGCSMSSYIPQSVEDDDDLDFVSWDGDDDSDGREPNSNGSDDEVHDSLSLVQQNCFSFNLMRDIGFCIQFGRILVDSLVPLEGERKQD
jgi:hypothetical protein